MKRVGIGIDFGTSNSSVAFYDGNELRYVNLDPVVGDGSAAIMPTALYLDRARTSTVGQPAVDRYLRDNAGRLVKLTEEDLGEIEITVAGTEDTQGPKSNDGAITNVVRIHAFTDRELPGRLFRSLKRWLADGKLDRVRVFDGRYRLVALVTPILAHMQELLEAEGLTERGEIRVGRPVRFEGTDDGERVAVGRLREACSYAGLGEVRLYPEPVAAALSFLRERKPTPGEVLLSFDFGGGTLDLCALRTTASGFEILGTHGIGLGGDAIDRLIYQRKVFSELGEGCTMPSQSVRYLEPIPFPFHEFAEKLLNWQLAYELNTTARRELILHGMRGGEDSRLKLGRLYDLVTRNQTYRVLRAVERAKVALSESERTTIEVPELELEIPLTRVEFERMLAEALAELDTV
ncbi:MAG: Hsp70 family protein, partial [bacterium]|nr:Hsp70 family protein [bacterium]